MRKFKYIIIGAGPSGLTLAHSFRQKGIPTESILVIEKEPIAGGLCRSQFVDGAPLDIGGGHFLDVKRQEVLKFLFHFMPKEEWQLHHRISKINLQGIMIDYPLEANLWQLPESLQVDYLESIAKAGSVRNAPMPESFVDWIDWKLGSRISQDYMLPYNSKIWSMDLDQLGTYWLYKLPAVSFRQTLQSCLERKPQGDIPAHGTFLYPKTHGYGEVWRRMGIALGDQLITGCKITNIDLERKTINNQFQAEIIINTAPWPDWMKFSEIPRDIKSQISKLHHASINVDYQPETLPTPAHWIYEPDPNLAHHRKLLRHNFCTGSRGYWTETNARRSASTTSHFRHHNSYAYPINTREKLIAIKTITEWAKTRGVIGAGRWGTWEHMNSDIAVHEAMLLADKLIAENTQ